MSNIVVFGPTQSGKTTLIGYLATGMLRHPQLNEEILQKLKLIKKLTTNDEFNIGNPYNPINMNNEIILPSFVSLDKDELRRFKDDESTIGSTKRLHRKRLTICVSENNNNNSLQDVNENISCVFVDVPGFRQRLNDKYRGFFEGEVGIAVLKLQEILELCDLKNSQIAEIQEIEKREKRLFEPIRIWCDYRSASKLVIAISQIDRRLDTSIDYDSAKKHLCEDINMAIECIRDYTSSFPGGEEILISPISIKLVCEKSKKDKKCRMSVFFRRKEHNIYKISEELGELPGDGTFISCLKRVMPLGKTDGQDAFFMASVYRPMRATVNGGNKTALNIRALHGSIHEYDNPILGPVLDKKRNEIIYSKCEISSIKADGADNCSALLLEGNAGGLIFRSIKDEQTNNKYILSSISSKSEISILKSTILYYGESKKGDLIKLEILMSEHKLMDNSIDEIYGRVLHSIMPYDEIVIFWYGKKFNVNVVEIEFKEEKLCLSVIPTKAIYNNVPCFVLPSNQGIIKYNDNVLLAIPRIYYTTRPKKEVQGLYTYVSSTIVDIENTNKFSFVKVSLDLESYDEQLNNDEQVEFNDIVRRNCIYKPCDNKNIILIPLGKERFSDIHFVLLKINKSIKSSFNRADYRNYEGVSIQLLE